jgi:hypothetical protein
MKNTCTYSIHIDCDNAWIYENELDFQLPFNNDYMYEVSLIRLLNLFEEYKIKATFFIVGKDLKEINACRNFCIKAINLGHKIGNHSYNHGANFGRLPVEEKRREILGCHELIRDVLGINCRGFRAPGYGVSDLDYQILADLGYIYDASSLPGPTTLLMKILTAHNKKYRGKALNIWGNLMAKNFPKKINLSEKKSIWRFPVSVIPVLRLPIHSSYIFLLGLNYLKFGLKMLGLTNTHKIILFHGLDLVDDLSSEKYSLLPMSKRNYQDRRILLSQMINEIKFKTMHIEDSFV